MDIDIGIIHFERFFLLKKTIKSLLPLVKCLKDNKFKVNLIMCDDSYNSTTINSVVKLCSENGIKYFHTGGKKGLSCNNNLLLKNSFSELLFHIQDDFILDTTPESMLKLVTEFIKSKSIMLRFYDVDSKRRFFDYSDTPHLKKKCFHNKIGYYPENIPMHKAELKMKSLCINEFKSSSLIYSEFDYFIHKGEDYTFNPINKRDKILNKLFLLKPYHNLSKFIKWLLGL
jgi:hypothetical protein